MDVDKQTKLMVALLCRLGQRRKGPPTPTIDNLSTASGKPRVLRGFQHESKGSSKSLRDFHFLYGEIDILDLAFQVVAF